MVCMDFIKIKIQLNQNWTRAVHMLVASQW